MTARNVQTAIVLQGGGALGAYEYGVLKALYESRPGFRPVAVAGISIGAITAAVLGGAWATRSARAMHFVVARVDQHARVERRRFCLRSRLAALRPPCTTGTASPPFVGTAALCGGLA